MAVFFLQPFSAVTHNTILLAFYTTFILYLTASIYSFQYFVSEQQYFLQHQHVSTSNLDLGTIEGERRHQRRRRTLENTEQASFLYKNEKGFL